MKREEKGWRELMEKLWEPRLYNLLEDRAWVDGARADAILKRGGR